MLLCPLITSSSITGHFTCEPVEQNLSHVRHPTSDGTGGLLGKGNTDIYRTSHLVHLFIESLPESGFLRGNICIKYNYPLLLYPLLKIHLRTFSHRLPYYQSSNPDHTVEPSIP